MQANDEIQRTTRDTQGAGQERGISGRAEQAPGEVRRAGVEVGRAEIPGEGHVLGRVVRQDTIGMAGRDEEDKGSRQERDEENAHDV